jgi:hypothetical protein
VYGWIHLTRQPGLNLAPLTGKYISALPQGQVTNRRTLAVDFQCGNVASDNITAGVIDRHEALWVEKREELAREIQQLGRWSARL